MIILPDDTPAVIKALPRDSRGYPIPWFVSYVDGQPEFRVADSDKLIAAIKNKLCWVCGTPLAPKQHVFVVGPLSTISRVSAEPPCHADCAVTAVKVCPFLTHPKATRREANMPETTSAGISVDRNPGVTCLWYCKGYTYTVNNGGVLFELPNPAYVRWWAEGRKATSEEVHAAFYNGVPIFEKLAREESPEAMRKLAAAVVAAKKLLPAT